MSLSTLQLKEDFRNHLSVWEKSHPNEKVDAQLILEIQNWGMQIEQFIQDKLRLLEADFDDHPLQGEYKRSVEEGFSDLERLMRNHKTLLDVVRNQESTHILNKIKNHYQQYLIPLLNIMGKLENDYISVVNQNIQKKLSEVEILEDALTNLYNEKKRLRSSFFEMSRKQKFVKVSKKIKKLEIRIKLTKLTTHHDRLNLYYFNHNRPRELTEIKNKADMLRKELQNIEREGMTVEDLI